MHFPLSITVLTGAPGTNAVRIFERLNNDAENLRVAAIVPWRAKKTLSESSRMSVMSTTERFQRLGKGCSCCTVRSDIMAKVRQIVTDNAADHVVIQLAPNSNLDMLTKTFTVPDDSGAVLGHAARIESVVTFIDARTVLRVLGSKSAGPLIARIEASQMLLVDGLSNLTPDLQEKTLSALRAINPMAEIEEDTASSLALSSLRKGGSTPPEAPPMRHVFEWRGPVR